jgi:hypothetical protein
LTNVFPTTQPVNITVTPSTPAAINVSNIYAGAINQTTVSFRFIQNTASTTWSISHNLGYYPNVTVVDSTATVCEGDIVYTSANIMTITFSQAISGVAYLS